jgi:hypothetical protein
LAHLGLDIFVKLHPVAADLPPASHRTVQADQIERDGTARPDQTIRLVLENLLELVLQGTKPSCSTACLGAVNIQAQRRPSPAGE